MKDISPCVRVSAGHGSGQSALFDNYGCIVRRDNVAGSHPSGGGAVYDGADIQSIFIRDTEMVFGPHVNADSSKKYSQII